jgi:hypothetical protein
MSLAGIYDGGAIVLGEDIEFIAQQFNLTLIQDVRAADPAVRIYCHTLMPGTANSNKIRIIIQKEIYQQHMHEFNRDIVVLQMPAKSEFLNGYALYTSAFSFYDEVSEILVDDIADYDEYIIFF